MVAKSRFRRPFPLSALLLIGCSLALGCQGSLSDDSGNKEGSGGDASGGSESSTGGSGANGHTGGGSPSGGRDGSGGMGGSEASGGMGGASTGGVGGLGGETSTGGDGSGGEASGGSGTGGDGSGGGPSCTSDDACALSAVGEYLCVENAAAQCVDPEEDGCLTLSVGDACVAGTYCSEVGETSCVSGDSCEAAIGVPARGLTLSGTSFVDDFTDSHDFSGSGCEVPLGEQPEAVFSLDLKAGEAFLVREFGFMDSMVGILESCDDGSACFDSWDDPDSFGFEYRAEIDETVFVWVSPYNNASQIQEYEIRIDRWLCGDGVTSDFEECDDANDTDFDGCTECVMDVGAQCETTTVPSVCASAPDLGTFAGGDAIEPTIHEAPVEAGSSFTYQITFSEPVWLAGTLSAVGTGDPRLVVRDASGGQEFAVSSDGGEEWEERSLPPGTYFLEVIANGATPLNSGFELTLETEVTTHLGTLSIAGSLMHSGSLPLQYDTDFLTFDLSETTVISGAVVGTSGDPDFFVLNSAGVQVVQENSGGSTESILDHELVAGRYYARVRAFAAVPSYELTLNGSAP